MPIYEYQCQTCQHALEAIQKFSDAPLLDCPACGAPALKKKISAAAFRLKGGGWYETDFKTGNKKNVADSSSGEKSSSGNSEKSSSGSGDAAPAKPAATAAKTATADRSTPGAAS